MNMGENSWTHIHRWAGLPEDAIPLVIKKDYAVAQSAATQLVFRVALEGAKSFDLNPSDVTHAHRIAHDMAAHGLNVLAPTAQVPVARNGYVISSSPLATPLMDAPWTVAEASDFARGLRAWSAYESTMLAPLDIPRYVRARAYDAVNSGGSLGSAGEWCLAALETLDRQTPFRELTAKNPGVIHGDVHPGNLVRYRGRILLIDLDSVKTGPALFDIAVGLVYQRRYSPAYPGSAMATGYFGSGDYRESHDLEALEKWKELSSYSQLLLRWHQEPCIPVEFWKRTKSEWNDRWTNIVRTPVLETVDAYETH